MAITERRPLVTLLDSGEIPQEICQSCLNESEIREAAAISNQSRKEDWVAGRIASKYAFLCRETSIDSSELSTLYLQKISRTDLAAFTVKEYRAVSVLRNECPSGGPARIGWSSGSGSVRAAISHTAGIACASVGAAGVCSLDLETPAPRVAEFYRNTFTSRERDWVGAFASSSRIPLDWLYTVLWSTRECLLKMPRLTALSLWHMPCLELEICDAVRLARIFNSTELSTTFEFFEASTSGFAFQLAVTGNSHLILTAITGAD